MALRVRFDHAGRTGLGTLEGGTIHVHRGELFGPFSREMTLLPGDVIACGTSLGVGVLRHGATVEAVIDGVGARSNPVAGAAGAEQPS